MRHQFEFHALIVSFLCLMSPQSSHGYPPARAVGFRVGVGAGVVPTARVGYGGWWWGYRHGFLGVSRYPAVYPHYHYGYPYYPDYDSYYSGGVRQSSFYTTPDFENTLQSQSPHPTGSSGAVPPPDAGLIRLQVPDKFAQVFFNGQEVSSIGTTRAYVTPILNAGTFQYQVKATWGATSREQTIIVARGRVSEVDFTAASEGKGK